MYGSDGKDFIAACLCHPEQWECFVQAESDVPPFHYGSHYSAAGVVLFYLIRLEPFTRLNRNLQVCDLIPYVKPASFFLFLCLWGMSKLRLCHFCIMYATCTR